MGGSSSGGGFPTRTQGDYDNCDFEFVADLFGPVPEVVEGLSINDALEVQLLDAGGTATVGVFTQDEEPQQAGTITAVRELPALVRCLQQGVEYEAIVRQIDGPSVSVIIRRT